MSVVKRRTICDSIHQNYELNLFLYTEFQEALEDAEVLATKTPEDESKPYVYKYQARDKLQALTTSPYLANLPNDKDTFNVLQRCANALLKYYIGVNYNDTEEYKEAETSLLETLQILNQLPNDIKLRYINVAQDTYNNLGIIYCNRANLKKGLMHFAKAEQMYELLCDTQGLKIVNRFNEFIKRTTGSLQQRECFGFFIDGGTDKAKLESNYTQTLFYMAQTYGKLNKADLSAAYCARTLQRQVESKNYQVKDWAVNCISLADYFLNNHNYAQAEYCIMAALAVLPPDQQKRKKLRATIAMQLGKYYAQRLANGIKRLQRNTSIEALGSLAAEASKKYVDFPSLKIAWPQVEDIRDLEKAKEFFRLANTQFKKALDFFVLDGYVTQHIGLRKDIAELYKTLAAIEPDPARLMAMLERRKEILEPVSHDINPKAFCAQMQEVWYELSLIYGEMHERAAEARSSKSKAKRQKALQDMNAYALKSAEYSKQLAELLQTLDEQNESVDQAIQVQYLNIAKMYSSTELENPDEAVAYYKQSLDYYMKIKARLEKNKSSPTHAEEYRLCTEMCEMLPIKISRAAARK